jgi:hypothetical protein
MSWRRINATLAAAAPNIRKVRSTFVGTRDLPADSLTLWVGQAASILATFGNLGRGENPVQTRAPETANSEMLVEKSI